MLFHSFTILRSHNNKKYGVQFTAVGKLSRQEIISCMELFSSILTKMSNAVTQNTNTKLKEFSQGQFSLHVYKSFQRIVYE